VTALVKSEVLKLWTTRLVPGLLLTFLGLIVLYVFVAVSQTSVTDIELSPEGPFAAAAAGVILVLMLGVTVTAGEYRHGTITATFLVAPRRERVLLAKLVAALLLGFAFAVAGVVVNVAVGWLAVELKGADVSPFDGAVTEMLGGTLLGCALWSALGAAIGAATRNQVTAIVGAVVWFLIAEPLFGSLLDHWGSYLPGAALGAIFENHGDLSRTGGILASLGWIAVIGAIGAVLVIRDDVN
jgi:ABC-type transport system involved in multi-copper enzyme maturation permease subunit